MDDSGARQNVEFQSSGSTVHGYLALPSGGRGPGVLVIQEWWGLTDHIASIVDRLAAAGFVALAPDLYGGRTTHDAAEANEMMQNLPAGQASLDLAGSVDYLLSREEVTGSKLGAVGFCMGGSFVLNLAVRQGAKIGAVVAFYPAGPLPEDFTGLAAPLQVHLGESDDFVPVSAGAEISDKVARVSGSDPQVHVYPAGHAFHNDDNLLGTYDPEQASAAWQRTLDFLHTHLI